MKSLTLLLVIGATALATVAEAQIITGRVIGRVTDETAAALPGATVSLESPDRPAVTGVTSRTGEYRLIQIEPGVYTLTVSLSGFATYREEGFVVNVGGTTQRDVRLQLASVAETITVTGESPMVDPRRLGVTDNVKRETIDVLPTRHDRIMEFAKWTPGVSSADPTGHGYDAAVLGSSTGANSTLIDGAEQQGRGDPETVGEIEAITIGASAEYMVAEGGVFNVVSKSGTNNWRMHASVFLQPDAAPFGSTPTKRPCDGCLENPGRETGYHQQVMRDWGAHIGGPIVRDRWWFYGGVNWFHREETQPGTDPDLEPRAARFSHGLPFVKVNGQMTDNLAISGMFFNGYWERPEGPSVNADTRTGVAVASPPETLLKSGGAIYSTHKVELNYIPNPDLLLTFRHSGTWNPNQYQKPLSGDITSPIHIDTGTGLNCCGVSRIRESHKTEFWEHFKIQKFVEGDRTSHNLRGGFQYVYDNSWRVDAWPSGVQFRDFFGEPDQARFRGPSVEGGRMNAQGLWFEDEVNFADRLTVMLGARIDRQHAYSPDLPAHDDELNRTGGTIEGIDDTVTWFQWAPRAGVNFRLTEDGRTSLRASAGRAYDQMSAGLLQDLHPGIATESRYRWDPATQDYTDLISVIEPNINYRLDTDIEPQVTDAYSVGLDRELMPNLAIGATYVHKRAKNFGGEVDITGVYGEQVEVLPDGRTLTVFPILSDPSESIFLETNGPGTFSRYHGLVLTMEKRFSDGWQGRLSYTRSKSTGMVSTDGDPNAQINNVGNLTSTRDRTNMVVGTATYNLPVIDTHFTTSFMFMTGMPRAPQVQIRLPQGRRSINIEPPGTFRLPSQTLVNFRFSKELFGFSGNHQFLVNLAITNAFQAQPATRFITNNFFSANFEEPDAWIQPRRIYFQFTVRN